MSFLRKQESRLVPAEAGIQPSSSRASGNPSNMDFSYLLASRFRGNDTRLACRFRDSDTGISLTRRHRRHRRPLPRREEAICFIRLKCYKR